MEELKEQVCRATSWWEARLDSAPRLPLSPLKRRRLSGPTGREAEVILARLAVQPDTARHLSATLNIPATLTAGALQVLQDEGMVSCRYVVRLTIYRRTL